MKEALFDVPLYRQFARLGGMNRLPDRVSILSFRHLLEQHELAPKMLEAVNATLAGKELILKEGTAVDASLIAAPSSTKVNTPTRSRDAPDQEGQPVVLRDKLPHWRGRRWPPGAHGGGHQADVNDATQAHALVHGEEADVFADADYQDVDKRDDTRNTRAHWHVARPDCASCSMVPIRSTRSPSRWSSSIRAFAPRSSTRST